MASVVDHHRILEKGSPKQGAVRLTTRNEIDTGECSVLRELQTWNCHTRRINIVLPRSTHAADGYLINNG